MERPAESKSPTTENWQKVKRLGGALLAGLAIGAVATPLLAEGTTVSGELGPVSAEVEITRNELVINGGLLGSISADVDLPFGLGATVTLGAIDEESVIIAQDVIASALNGELTGQEEWLFALGDIKSDIQHMKQDLLLKVLARGALAAGLTAGAIAFSTEFLLGTRRRRELGQKFKDGIDQTRADLYARFPHALSIPLGRSTAALSVVAAVGGAGVIAQELSTASDSLQPETLIENSVAVGPIKVIQQYGPVVIDKVSEFMGETDDFFDTVESNLTAALDVYEFERVPGSRVALIFSDNHGNKTAEMLSIVAQAFEADAVMNAGDVSSTGSAAEAKIIANDLQSHRFPDAFFVALGNHDSEAVGDQLGAIGLTVLDGTLEQGGGFWVIGAPDPRESTPLGTTPLAEGAETPQQLADRIVDEACRQNADVVLAHDFSRSPEATQRAVACGIDLVLAGHMHAHKEPIIVEDFDGSVRTVLMDSLGSSTGAVEDALRYGPFQGTAYVYVVEYGPDNTWAAVHVITIDKFGSVQIYRIESSGYPHPAESLQNTPEPSPTVDTQ